MFWHHLPALIGISIGGPLSDWLVLRRPTARLELQAVAMALGVPSIVLMALAPNLTVACVGLALFGWFRGLYESNTHAAMFDVIEHRYRASAVAITVMIAFLVGSTSPWLLGKCREWFGAGPRAFLRIRGPVGRLSDRRRRRRHGAPGVLPPRSTDGAGIPAVDVAPPCGRTGGWIAPIFELNGDGADHA